MHKIYCVEDDTNIRELILYALNSGGFEARGFSCADEFFCAMKTELPSLVLLDIMLPGDDGISILKRLRSSSSAKAIPVIMLTAKSTEYDKVAGLESGADDYITKPFSVIELIARIKALLRRSDNFKAPSELTFKNIAVDVKKHTVTVGGEAVNLTLKEFELLSYLLENEGVVLSRDKIMNAVWGFDYEGESRTVDMHIKTLRQKLGSGGDCIVTVRGIGYKIGG